MADNEEMRMILDQLQPIFPQLSAYYLLNCIRDTSSRVGNDRAAIIPSCIDVLLAGTDMNQQVPLEAEAVNRTQFSSERDDDVIFTGLSTQENKQPFILIDDERNESGNVATKRVETIIIDPLPLHTEIFAPQGEPFTFANNSTSGICSCIDTITCTHSHTQKPGFSNNDGSRNVEENSFSSVQTNDPPTQERTEQMSTFVNEVRSLFPQIDEDYLKQLGKKYSNLPSNTAVHTACDELLEMKDFPKKTSVARSECSTTPKKCEDIDYFKDFSVHVSFEARRQCEQLLLNDFRTVSKKDICKVLAKYNYHYAPARKCLEESLLAFGMKQNPSSTDVVSSPQKSSQERNYPQDTPPKFGQNINTNFINVTTSNSPITCDPNLVNLTFLKRRRRQSTLFQSVEPQLQQEIVFFQNYKSLKSEEDDRKLAFLMNEQEYEEEGQKIECGCCFGEVAFEEMVQCQDGHLFCLDCLKSYAKEAVYGSGKAILRCMTPDCESTFPVSQLQKALPADILTKYEDRMQEESILLAEMEDLVRCPSCGFAALLPPEDKVFKCQLCAKETCRYCKEEWAEHFGQKCSEIEKKSVRDVRLSYEERMTMAKIRKCTKCGCEFTKSDGCNKMTCRCGTTQCYVCRKPNIHYQHFCQHPKEPGKPCTKCNKCNLWSDPSEDDDRAVRELEKEAENAKRELDAGGVTEESGPAAKKPRLSV